MIECKVDFVSLACDDWLLSGRRNDFLSSPLLGWFAGAAVACAAVVAVTLRLGGGGGGLAVAVRRARGQAAQRACGRN